MDRKGEWRLKPQVADTLQRDVQAIMAQTGWQRSRSRLAQDQTTMGTNLGIEVGRDVSVSDTETTGGRGNNPGRGRQASRGPIEKTDRTTAGRFGARVGFESHDTGSTSASRSEEQTSALQSLMRN